METLWKQDYKKENKFELLLKQTFRLIDFLGETPYVSTSAAVVIFGGIMPTVLFA